MQPREQLGNRQFLLSIDIVIYWFSLGPNSTAIRTAPVFSDQCKKILLEKIRMQEGCYPEEFLTSTLRISRDEGVAEGAAAVRMQKSGCRAAWKPLQEP
jgi:hypothetical protein